jgi:GDP-L-fucose synthase
MLGRAIVRKLCDRGANVLAATHNDYDLLNEVDCTRMLAYKPDFLIHGAAVNGNISYNISHPAIIYGETVQIGLNVLGSAVADNTTKIVNLISSCAYAPSDEPLKESNFLNGTCDETVECHGLAKRAVYSYAKTLHKQFGTKFVHVILNNCYGFAPFDRPYKLKVADALVSKFVDAKLQKQNQVTLFGDGSPRRELLFCEDAAEGVVRVLEEYEDSIEPINIGCGKDISIKELADTIAKLTGYQGEVIWDISKPNGQMRKLLDNTKMKEVLNWEPPTGLNEGLRKTIDYFVRNFRQEELAKFVEEFNEIGN